MAKATARRPAAALVPRLPADEVVEFDVPQNTPEWDALRCGVITASNFSKVMASGVGGADELKGRDEYMRKLTGEILTGTPAEHYRNASMDRGHNMEAEARALHTRRSFANVRLVGFVKRTIHRPHGPPLVVGCSPDSLLDDDGVLEIKTQAPHLMIPQAKRGTFPSEHRWQCHGALLVTGRAYCDLRIFFKGMPISPTYRVQRDEALLKELFEGLERFEYELRQLVAAVRKMGGE